MKSSPDVPRTDRRLGVGDRRRGRDRRARPRLGIIPLADGLGEWWAGLAAELGFIIDILQPDADVQPQPDTVAIILSVGGADRVAEWFGGHRLPHGLPVIVVGADRTRRRALDIVAAGATNYFALPDDGPALRDTLSTTLTGWRASADRAGDDPFSAIVGVSPALRRTLERATAILPHANAGALIVGETGTGKTLLARALHNGGPRFNAPFVTINCAAIPGHAIESELFGKEGESVTAPKPGLFEIAHTGTLFLDEVGELPASVQLKLLRALEDKEIWRVGGTAAQKVDVRVLAATPEHLVDRVRNGAFREDLYYQLSTVVLRLPPLRERGDDVLLVAGALLERLAAEHDLPAPPLTAEVRDRLVAHPWPGNVRELRNTVERALLLSPVGTLDPEEFRPPVDGPGPVDQVLPYPATLHAIAAAAATLTLQACGGNRAEAARRLGISPRRLRRILERGED